MGWRQKFSHRIERVLSAYPEPGKARDAALALAYPLAAPWRDGPPYPYRVWRDEIARQLGIKPAVRAPRHATRCAYTLELFDQARCPLTIDLFA